MKTPLKTTDGDGYGLRIAKDKTIMGKDSAATIYGGLAIAGVSNVIVYNLNIHGTYPDPGPSDGIAVGDSHHVWLTRLNIWYAEDGNLDITNKSNRDGAVYADSGPGNARFGAIRFHARRPRYRNEKRGDAQLVICRPIPGFSGAEPGKFRVETSILF